MLFFLSIKALIVLKLFSRILPLVLVAITLVNCNHESGDRNKKTALVVGLSADYPPFEYQKNGKLVGLDIDFAYALAEEMGVEIKLQDMSFHNIITALQTGKIDMGISGFTPSPERLKSVDFSIPYYTNSLVILYLNENPPSATRDFSSKKLGVQLGSTMERWAKEQTKGAKDAQIIAFDTNPPLVEKLKLHQLDYVILEKAQAEEFVKAHSELKFDNIGEMSEGVSVALKKDSPLLEKVNKAISTLKEKGVLKAIQEKWLKVERASN